MYWSAGVGSETPAQWAEDGFHMIPGMHIAKEELSGSAEELCCWNWFPLNFFNYWSFQTKVDYIYSLPIKSS